jgi:HPt (histidine-containing phosphotransfer) domain-containing protein
MALSDELEPILAAAAALAAPGERLSGVLVAEPLAFGRVYLCAFESDTGHTWVALDAGAAPVTTRETVREAAELAALCEVAEEAAGGGNLPELRERLRELRETEAPEGIEEAEEAARALAEMLQPEPRLASTDYLDRLGSAARRLEQALGNDAGSPFGAAMQQALPAVEELADDVERTYKGPLA